MHIIPLKRAIARTVIVFLLILSGGFTASAQAADSTNEPEQETPGLFQRLHERRLVWVATTDAWLFAGAGGIYANLQDTTMSPLIYSGFGTGLIVGDVIVRDHWTWPTTLTAHVAAPQVPEELEGTYQNLAADLDTMFLWRFGPGGALSAGGGLRGGTGIRIYDKLQNSSTNYDIVVSASASVALEEPFSLFSRQFVWHARAAAPVFSYVQRRPEYALHNTTNYWLPPWRFMRFTFETGLTWNLRWSEENMIRVLYIWDFYGMDELDGLHALRIASHGLTLSLGLRRM